MKIRMLLTIACIAAAVFCGCRVEIPQQETPQNESAVISQRMEESTKQPETTVAASAAPDVHAHSLPPVVYYLSEEELRKAINSKDTDPIITAWDKYYVSKNVPDGFEHQYITIREKTIGIIYAKEDFKEIDGIRQRPESGEAYFLWWEKDLWPEYIEHDIAKMGMPVNRYKDFYILRYDDSCYVEWAQDGVRLSAFTPPDLTNEQIEAFCDVVSIKLK